jgi:hypothetical protein
MMLDSDRIKKSTFRNLVIGLFISFAYDIFWFYVSSGGYRSGEVDDGGLIKSVKMFSLVMTVLSFFFRVSLTALIFAVYSDSGLLEGLNRFLEDH